MASARALSVRVLSSAPATDPPPGPAFSSLLQCIQVRIAVHLSLTHPSYTSRKTLIHLWDAPRRPLRNPSCISQISHDISHTTISLTFAHMPLVFRYIPLMRLSCSSQKCLIDRSLMDVLCVCHMPHIFLVSFSHTSPMSLMSISRLSFVHPSCMSYVCLMGLPYRKDLSCMSRLSVVLFSCMSHMSLIDLACLPFHAPLTSHTFSLSLIMRARACVLCVFIFTPSRTSYLDQSLE